MEELIKVTYDNDKPTVSGRDLHEFLGVVTPYSKWFARMCEYGFTSNVDFITVDKNVLRADGATMPQTQHDHQITIEMAKEIGMIQRNDKGKQIRQYFIEIEKRWNTPDMVLARGMKVAGQKIETLQNEVKALNMENDCLSEKVLEWTDTSLINASIRKYASENNIAFGAAWRDFFKELLYKHSINLESRKTKYLNTHPNEKNRSIISFLDESEIPKAVSTVVALCRNANVDISKILSKQKNLLLDANEAN